MLSGFVLFAQSKRDELQPSNMDPAPKSQPPTYHEPRQKNTVPAEQKWSLTQYVDPSDPRFYAKVGLLLGSVLLAMKAFRQMRDPH